MKNIVIFDVRSLAQTQRKIKAITHTEYQGFVYAIEYGEYVKIGITQIPAMRLAQLKRQAEFYGDMTTGRFALSAPCTNFAELEKSLHERFSYCRKGNSELFKATFDDVVSRMSECDFRDESHTLSQESKVKEEWIVEYMANAMHRNEENSITPVTTINNEDGCYIKVGIDLEWECVSLCLNHFEDDNKWSAQPLTPKIARDIANKLIKYADVTDTLISIRLNAQSQ